MPGTSKQCRCNKLAALIARKREERYCDVTWHVRTMIRFAMLRTTLMALRRYRGKKIDINLEKSRTTSSLPNDGVDDMF